MPANIALGAFIVGAILLLLAVSHGGFKIFGAEMSGAEGRAPRIVAGLCGALLLGFGAGNRRAPTPRRTPSSRRRPRRQSRRRPRPRPRRLHPPPP